MQSRWEDVTWEAQPCWAWGMVGKAGRFPETSSEETDAALPLHPSISILAHLLLIPALPSTHPPPVPPDHWVLNRTPCFQTPTPSGGSGIERPRPTPACAFNAPVQQASPERWSSGDTWAGYTCEFVLTEHVRDTPKIRGVSYLTLYPKCPVLN